MKTFVAAVDADLDLSIAALIPHINSIFTAEVIALWLAITILPSANSIIFLLSQISQEDLHSNIKKCWNIKNNFLWMKSDYRTFL